MEFVIRKEDLVHELQTVTGVVEKRATLPILANLLLEAKPTGLEVGASDLEVTIRGTAKASVTHSGGITLPAGKLYEIARSLPEADVKFKSTDRGQVVITCERVRYKIGGQPRDEFPKLPDVDADVGIPLPAAVLREMIDRVSFAITMEDPRYSLRGALLQLQGGELTLVATDGYRLAYAKRKIEAGRGQELRLVVPRKALSEVSKLASAVGPDEKIVLGRGGDHIFFVVGGHVLTTTVPEGQFPKYEEVMPERCDTIVELDTQDLSDAVRRVSLLASDRFGKAVRFSLTSGKLELSSETEMGEAQEALAVDYEGDEKVIGFNAKYVLDFLAVVGSEKVQLELDPRRRNEDEGAKRRAGDKPGQFRPSPAGDLDYRYIVMPRDI